ncbi:MAG TPA: uroporphyrinogen-III synthase [Candidatus Dormibacteraeota bacterium]|nr:uroporphyrinogen-III synthase [Candidatus Dormibacteraeota bacterium]
MTDTDKPLAGRRIVVTRAPEQAAEMVHALEDLGAEVAVLPLVAFAPPDDCNALDEALRNLSRFDAILFLSRNAVRYVFQRCRTLGMKCELLGGSNRSIAAVGPATAEEAAKEGLRVSFVAENRTGESLVGELRDKLAGCRVLLPRSDRGDARVPFALREAGATVTEVVAYRTLAPDKLNPEILGRIVRGDVDCVVFASPSAFRNFSKSIGREAANKIAESVHFAAIGPTTARAIREAGARVDIEVADAASIGVPSIAGALAQFFRQSAATPVRTA